MKKDMRYEQIFAMPPDRFEEIMQMVIEKCKNDKGLEQELLKHPTETLKKEGIQLQTGISFQVVKTVEEATSLPDNVIPLSFENKKGALSPEDLKKVSGGVSLGGMMGSMLSGPSTGWKNFMNGVAKLTNQPPFFK